MSALRRVIIALVGLVMLGMAALTVTGLINHAFATEVVDFLDHCFVYNLRLIFVDGKQLWQAIVAIVAFLLVGVLLIMLAFQHRKSANLVRVAGTDGAQVEVSLSAVEGVVRQAVSQVAGVRNLTTKLRAYKNALRIDLNMEVPANEILPNLGAEVRRTVSAQVQALLGVAPKDIRVKITSLTDLDKAVARLEAPPAAVAELEPEAEFAAQQQEV